MLEFPQRTYQETVLTGDEHTLSSGCSALVCSAETTNARLILEYWRVLVFFLHCPYLRNGV